MLREPTPKPVTNRPDLMELRGVHKIGQGKEKLTAIN